MSSLTRCPSCQSTLQVPEDRLGRSVRCGRCETIFTATNPESQQPEPNVRREEPPSRREMPGRSRRSRYDDDDDFDDRYYDIRRRDRYSRSDARSRVAGPAITLMVYGAFLIILGLLFILIALWAVMELTQGPKNAIQTKNGDAGAALVISILGAVCGFICGPIIFVGGYRMRQLRSWGLAMTATVMTFVIGGLVCIVMMLIGIWPLIVLIDKDVKRAFDRETDGG